MQTPPAFTGCALLRHVIPCERRLLGTTDKNTELHFPLFFLNLFHEKTGRESAARLHKATTQTGILEQTYI